MINPWIYDFTAFDLWSKPLGLLYLAAFLRSRGFNIELIDCLAAKTKTRRYGTGNFRREEVAKPEILRHVPRNYARYGVSEAEFFQKLEQVRRPDAILVTSVMTYWYPGPQYAVELLRKKYPEVPVILGGIYATLLPEHARRVVRPDYIVTGPGEAKVLELLQKILGTGPLPTAEQADLDAYPYPAFDLIQDQLDYLLVMTARGCPFNCSFCAQRLVSMPFRQRNPEAVVEEMTEHYFRYRLRDFAFYDDALFVNRDVHIKIILENLIRRNLPLRLHAPNGLFAGQIDAELADLMYRAHFKTVRLSFETSSEHRRRDLSNKISNQGMIDAVAALCKAGFERSKLEAYVIMGLPDQEIDEVLASLIFVNDLGLLIQPASYSPIPGTRDFERAVQNRQIAEDVDPLLTNKTIYPLYKDEKDQETFRRVRVFTQMLNEAARKKFCPFSDKPFADGIHRITGVSA